MENIICNERRDTTLDDLILNIKKMLDKANIQQLKTIYAFLDGYLND